MKYSYNADELVHLYNGLSRLIDEEKQFVGKEKPDKQKIKALRHLRAKIHLEI